MPDIGLKKPDLNAGVPIAKGAQKKGAPARQRAFALVAAPCYTESMTPNGGPGSPRLLPIFLILAAPLVAGAFVSTGWSWGWDHLHRAGPVWTAALFLLGIALSVPAGQRVLHAGGEALGRQLERDRFRIPILLAIAGLLLFISFPIATRMYGDSKVIVDTHTPAHLAAYIHRLLHFGLLGRGSACFALHDLVSRATGLSFERSFMCVSILCGGIFLFAHARAAATLPVKMPWIRVAILWLGLTDGANQLFFGHIETYIVPRLFECLFFIGVIQSLMDEDHPPRIGLPMLWLALAIFFHFQALVLLPTALLWAGRALARRHPRLRPWVGKRTAAAGLLAAVAGLAFLYIYFGSRNYDYIYSGGRPHPQQLFLPLTTARAAAPYPRYTLFSGAHFLDLFGSLYSISSAAVLVTIVLLLPAAWRDERTFVLLPSIVTALLHDLVLNPAIGFPFDWDLMCVISPPLLYTAVFLLARNRFASRGLFPAVIFLGLGTATLFGINADRMRVYHRVEDMGVWLHKSYFGGSHWRLGANLSTIQDPELQIKERARVLQRLAPDAYPDDREVAFLWERLAQKKIEREDYIGGKEAYRHALATEPSRWDRMKPLGYLEAEVGDRQEGIRLLSAYLQKAPEDGEGWLFLGDAYAEEGIAEEARRSWSRFLELTPDAPEAPRVREDLRRLDQGAGGGSR